MTEKKKLTEKFEECLHHILCGSKGIEEYLEERAIACADIALSYTEDRVKELETELNRKRIEWENQRNTIRDFQAVGLKHFPDKLAVSEYLDKEISALKGKLEVAEKDKVRWNEKFLDKHEQYIDCKDKLDEYADIKAKEMAIGFREWFNSGEAYLFDNVEQKNHTDSEHYDRFLEELNNKKP